MLQNPERLISRKELLSEVWGYQNYPRTLLTRKNTRRQSWYERNKNAAAPKSGMMEPGAAGFQEFQLWCDLKDDARGIRSALRCGAVEIADGVEDHIAERRPAVGSAGKVMQRSQSVTAT